MPIQRIVMWSRKKFRFYPQMSEILFALFDFTNSIVLEPSNSFPTDIGANVIARCLRKREHGLSLRLTFSEIKNVH